MGEEIKKGDTVRLKSGGPLMTVQSIADNEASCTWFDDKNNRKEGIFDPATLKADTRPAPGISTGSIVRG